MKMQVVYTADKGKLLTRIQLRLQKGEFSHVLLAFTCDEAEMRACVNVIKGNDRLRKLLCDKNEVSSLQALRADSQGVYRFYIESIWSKDSYTGQTGVRGPYPLQEVIDWHDKDPKHRRMEIQDLPARLRPDQVWLAYVFAVKAVGQVTYPKPQIFFNWRGIRLKAGIPFYWRTADQWTCVELIVRVLMHVMRGRIIYKLLRLGDIGFDEYAPSGKRSRGIFEMLGGK